MFLFYEGNRRCGWKTSESTTFETGNSRGTGSTSDLVAIIVRARELGRLDPSVHLPAISNGVMRKAFEEATVRPKTVMPKNVEQSQGRG
jgi:hypothetical protein